MVNRCSASCAPIYYQIAVYIKIQRVTKDRKDRESTDNAVRLCGYPSVEHPRSCQEKCSLSGSLASSHLLGLSRGVRVHLLLEEGPGLVSLLLQVLEVGDQLNGVNDSVVVKEHASDLASGVTVLSLDVSVDAVADFLAALSGLHSLKTLEVNGLRLGHLLLHGHLSLVRGHLGVRSHSDGVDGLLLLRNVAVTATLTGRALAAAVVLELTTALAVVALLVARGTIVVVVVATLTVATWCTTTVLTAVLHVVAVERSLGKEALHEVLLHLLEAALLALLVQLLGGHPELNGEGAGTEGS